MDNYSNLIEHAADAIAILQDGVFKLVNGALVRMSGYDREELLGMPLIRLLTPEYQKAVMKRYQDRLAGKEVPSIYEAQAVTKSGEVRDIEINAALTECEGHAADEVIIRDITERKRAQEREKELQQELNLSSRLASIGQLAAGVAHEINNPLTGVIGFSQLLLNRDIPEEVRKDVEVINSQAQRVAKIVENLLTFARKRERGQEYVDINNLISEVLELRSYGMKVHNIEARCQLAPDLPQVMGDAGQLQQVFLNIILNAEKEMITAHNKGRMVVKTERTKDTVKVSFADDGPGISRENLDRIFDPFFTTREVGDGAGLGLSICHGIITQHKGRISAESELGKGATFVVELPILPNPLILSS